MVGDLGQPGTDSAILLPSLYPRNPCLVIASEKAKILVKTGAGLSSPGSLRLFCSASLAWVGYHFFRAYQGKRLTSRARSYLSVGDLRSAGLACKTVLQSNPHNVEALRILAETADKTGEAVALDWRQRVLAELPDSLPDGVALVRTAVRLGQPGVAETTLRHFAPAGQNSAAYHEAAATFHLAKKDREAAKKEYREALRLNPENEEYQLGVAVLDLESSPSEEKTAARESLHGLMEKESVRLRAARALLEDAIERRDPELISIAEKIFNWPEATPQDRIRYIEISSELHLPGFPGALSQIQEEAQLDPLKLTELLSWMSENHKSILALEWVKRLSPATLQQRPVFVALADCYLAAGDCPGLTKWLRAFSWNDLEFLRHAYSACADRRCSDAAGAEVEWARALQAANNTEAVLTLQRAAAKWGWEKESVALLWQLSKDRSQQVRALTTLNDYYTKHGDTNNLYKVTSRWLQVAPNDVKVKNNFAVLSLLLGVNTDDARAIAKQLYQQEPTNADYASTYAFALYGRGDARGALKIMNALPAAELQRPEIAAYYGVFLSAAKDRARAPSFLELARQAKLLPEEKALVEKATGASSNLR